MNLIVKCYQKHYKVQLTFIETPFKVSPALERLVWNDMCTFLIFNWTIVTYIAAGIQLYKSPEGGGS